MKHCSSGSPGGGESLRAISIGKSRVLRGRTSWEKISGNVDITYLSGSPWSAKIMAERLLHGE